jgi:hypothetical protein
MGNAFTSSLVNSQGQNPFESQSGYGSPLADYQRDFVIQPMVQNRVRGAGGFSALSGGSPFSPAGQTVHAPTINLNLGGGQDEGNPFETLKNVKNTALQSAMDSVLNGSKDVATDFNKNPFTVRSNVKDQDQQNRISAAGGRFDNDVLANRQSLEEFTKNYLGGDGTAKNFMQQETGAIGNIYGAANDPNSMAYNLAKIRNDQSLAVNRDANNQMRNALAQTKLNSLMGVNDSSVDAALMNAAGNIASQAALTNAGQARTDYMSLLNAQSQMAGRRSGLQDDYLKRSLVPMDVRMRLGANELGQANQLGQMNLANNFYNLDSPEQMYSRKMGLLGQYQDMDLRNNFYGLKKPYENNGNGYYFPNQGGGYGGGGGGNYGMPNNGGWGDQGMAPQGGLPPWAVRQRALASAARYPSPGMNAGSGNGFMAAQDGTYDLSNQFNYGDPNLQHGAWGEDGNPQLYIPGYNPANIAAQQDYYENPERY